MFISRQQLPPFQRMGTLICRFLVVFLLVVDVCPSVGFLTVGHPSLVQTDTSSAQIYTRVVLSLHALQIQPLWALCRKKILLPKATLPKKTILLKV
ncbi:hypothetical protein L210DRAFT_2874969 [Boletus edulis BED1]|uniref:Uncharacterized protein n=1 Tax=Boletus edulis BED1 TaxID=1328754 RepID=A0AAD4BIH0_BOLED|nr:hypothetical protein L210DRAFT_2874969 [Boletus edulis BED1]